MTDYSRDPSIKIRIGYLVAGVVTGVLWLVNDGSPVEHARRLLVLVAVVMTVSWVVRRVAARCGREVPRHPIGRDSDEALERLVAGASR